MMDGALWALGRGAGIITVVLFSVGTALGLITASRRGLPGTPRFVTTVLHRNVSLLAVVFLALHVVTMVLDSYAGVSTLDLVVPFVSAAEHPLAIGLGTVALDLALALSITGLLRHRIGARGFRLVHAGGWLMWPVAVLHGVTAGTDAGSGWFLAVTAGCVLMVAAAGALRLMPPNRRVAVTGTARRGI